MNRSLDVAHHREKNKNHRLGIQSKSDDKNSVEEYWNTQFSLFDESFENRHVTREILLDLCSMIVDDLIRRKILLDLLIEKDLFEEKMST